MFPLPPSSPGRAQRYGGLISSARSTGILGMLQCVGMGLAHIGERLIR